MINRVRIAIQHNYRLLFLAIIVYFLGILLGIFLGMDPNQYLDKTKLGPYYQALPIIQNNLKVSLYLLSGLLTLGVSAILVLLYNGIMLGNVIILGLQQFSAIEVAVRLFPHGIMEIPGIIFITVAGLQSVKALISNLKGNVEKWNNYLLDCFIFTLISVTCITIAGFIEAYITVLFIK